MIRENARTGIPGGLMLLVLLGLGGASTWSVAMSEMPIKIVAGVVLGLVVIGLTGFFVVNPNEARVLQLFGRYVGTVKTAGWHWANPFLSKKRITLRAISFESGKLK